MDDPHKVWHYSDMRMITTPIPAWQLYGEAHAFPDILHCERIRDRAAGLHWTIPEHRHVHLHQFFLIQAGDAVVNVDGQTHAAAPTTLISLPRGTVHGFQFSDLTDGYVLTIPVQELPDLLGDAASGPLGQFAIVPDADAFADAFNDIHTEYYQAKALRAPLLRALATRIAVQLARQLFGTGDHPNLGAVDPRVTTFTTLVQAHFRNRWPVTRYAATMALSPRHLSRLCRAATGLSAERFIEATTFQEACRLLAYTRMSAASVGYHLGFDDPSYFSRAFQRHCGLSPTAYRRRLE